MQIEACDRLPADDVLAVRALAGAIERTDGEPPLSDQALLQVGAQARDLTHLVVRDSGRLIGYAQVDRSGPEAVLELAVPDRMLDVVLEASEAAAAGPLLVWAHGRGSAVAAAAEARGYERVRVLHQLRRPLTDLPDTPVPPGVAVRTFVPGRDEADWLRVNADAFAHHAEQGRMTRRDLDLRMAEDWFNPAGFFLAHRDGELIGFHWTKVHAGPPPVGEVYVLGVGSAGQGLGLGAALLSAGLRHLAAKGLDEVLLYSDESNEVAMRLYQKAGFVVHDTDLQLRKTRDVHL